jgi:hypothetical protein
MHTVSLLSIRDVNGIINPQKVLFTSLTWPQIADTISLSVGRRVRLKRK